MVVRLPENHGKTRLTTAGQTGRFEQFSATEVTRETFAKRFRICRSSLVVRAL
jgi:hypothetical protein